MYLWGSRSWSWLRMSWRTRRVALAVNAAMGCSGKCVRKTAQLPVLGSEFMAPLRNAVRFIDGEETERNVLQPAQGVFPRQAFGRQVQQTELAFVGASHDASLF